MEPTGNISSIFFIFLNSIVFIAGIIISKKINKSKNNKQQKIYFLIATTIFSTILLVLLFRSHSLYKDIHLDKCLSKRETDKYFRNQLRKLHPDNTSGENKDDATYKLYNNLREILTDNFLRTFYEKYDFKVENGSLSKTKSQSIMQYLFQDALNSHLFLSFTLLLISLAALYYFKVIEYNGLILKLIFSKTFLIIYLIYFKKNFDCNFLDYIFKNQTLYQQMYYFEIWSSFVLGLFTMVFIENCIKEKKEISGKCDNIIKNSGKKMKKEYLELIKKLKAFYDI